MSELRVADGIVQRLAAPCENACFLVTGGISGGSAMHLHDAIGRANPLRKVA